MRFRRLASIGALLLLAGWGLLKALPPPLREGVSVSKAIFDRHGRLLRLSLTPDEKYRLWLPVEAISPTLVAATLEEEDRYFYWHPGFNPPALVRSVFHSYLKRDKRMGGSTLTMQLARLRYQLNTRSFTGKLKQIVYALRLEAAYSKREILAAYLNLAPYGLNVEGVGAASLIYFHKSAQDLSAAEALFLVALPQSPSLRSPTAVAGRGPVGGGLSYVKAKLVKRWIAQHPQYRSQEADLLRPLTLYLPRELPFEAPHFTDDLTQTHPQNSLLHSTLDRSFQNRLKRQLQGYVQAQRVKGIENAAALVIHHRTMEVLASVGSANYFDPRIQGQVNGTRAKRSPGSTLKPFVYALALEQGLIHPLTLLKDTPRRYGALNPENADYDFMGPIAATSALNLSRNLPALALAAQLHDPDLYELLRQARIDLPETRAYYGVGLALGGAELTLEELVTLYATLAHGGELRPLRKLQAEETSPAKPLYSEEAAFMVREMLKENVPPGRESLRRLAVEREPVAWKTGTSHGFRDAWAIGVTDSYVIGVWVGDFQGRSNPAFIGREAAAPLLFQIAESLPPLPPTFAHQPRDLTRVKVCTLSGGLPGPHCQSTRETWYWPGRSPFETCTVHRGLWIHNHSGLRTCERYSGESHWERFEVWDSELSRLFRLAGIPRRQIPPLDPRCRQLAPAGKPPEITSPTPNAVYAVRVGEGRPAQQPVPLIANVEGGKRSLYWFANERFLGKAQNAEPFFWQASPGRYVVRAVDDFGQASARELQIVTVR